MGNVARGILGHLSRLGKGPLPQVRLNQELSRIDAAVQARAPLGAMLDVLESARQPLFECLHQGSRSEAEAKAVTLKILNLCLAKYHFRAGSATVLSRPFGLIIDPSNVCNLACPGCVHSTHVKELRLFDWGKGMLPANRLDAFLASYGPHAIHVNFCNYGEPLINPETPRFIRLAKTWLMKTMLSTSLSLDRFDAEAYVASGLDYMIVSIDGASQPVYEIFRRKGRLDLVLGNLRKLVEARRKLSRQTPTIAWRFITFRHNIHEIPQALEMAREIGVDQFLTLAPYDVTWDDPAIQAAEIPTLDILINPRAEACVLENWSPFPGEIDAEALDRIFANPWVRPAGLQDDAAPAPSGSNCHWLYKSITVDAGGRIFPCCAAPRPDIDLVFSQFDAGGSASAVFNTDKYRLARLSFGDGAAYRSERELLGISRDPHCANCDWNKETPNVGPANIRQYFKSAAGALFDEAGFSMLSSW